MESDGEVKMKKVLSLLTIISEVTEREKQTWKHSPQVFLGAKLGMQKKTIVEQRSESLIPLL